jgi:hypothetical protein
MTTDYEKLNHKSISIKKQPIKLNTPELWEEVRINRNKLTNLKNKYKASIIKESVDKAENSSKKCWKIFNEETGRTKRNYDLPNLIYNGKVITDEKQKLNSLCESFVKPKITLPPYKGSTPPNPESLEEIQFTEQDVFKAIKNMDQNKPTGADGIPPLFYKLCQETITPSMKW